MENFMIDREFARSQVLRLAGLRRFPNQKEAVGELIDVLQAADTQDLAKQAIDEIHHDAKQCPMPSELRHVIRNLEAPIREAREKRRGMGKAPCPYCEDIGWVYTHVIRAISGVETGRYTGVELCRCRGGKGA
jgi:hypothetical protein